MHYTDAYLSRWRIAASADTLARRNLITLGIPPPALLVYNEASQRVPGLDGSQKLRGGISIQVNWEPLTRAQAARLRAAIEAGQSAGWLYMTVDRSNAQSSGEDWVDIRGKAYTPQFAPVARSYGQAYEAVSLQLADVEIINAPSAHTGVNLTYSLDFSENYNSGYLPIIF